jgi:hypothetical protein
MGELTMKSKTKEKRFPCFRDEEAVEKDSHFSRMLKPSQADNDMDS